MNPVLRETATRGTALRAEDPEKLYRAMWTMAGVAVAPLWAPGATLYVARQMLAKERLVQHGEIIPVGLVLGFILSLVIGGLLLTVAPRSYRKPYLVTAYLLVLPLMAVSWAWQKHITDVQTAQRVTREAVSPSAVKGSSYQR